ncbi:cyclic nucleotide-binding-like protein [Cladochytrium replicatum]|nr:cyclic nucleotide-binding-like protein [Cladochytrium replicatum]
MRDLGKMKVVLPSHPPLQKSDSDIRSSAMDGLVPVEKRPRARSVSAEDGLSYPSTKGLETPPRLMTNSLPRNLRGAGNSPSTWSSPSTPEPFDDAIATELVTVIRAHPLFAKVQGNDDFFRDICSSMSLRHYQPGDVVVREGDMARAMFFVVKGTVTVISGDGEITFAELSAGSFFGEIGILFNIARTATVSSKTKCVLAALTADTFQKRLAQYPEVGLIINGEAQERFKSLARESRSGAR